MHTELYLDTARLGRMCDEARRAEQDFATLVSLLGSSLYLEDFLYSGFDGLPQSLQDTVPQLRTWQGIRELRSAFYSMAFRTTDVDSAHSFLCSDSRTLIDIAAKSLFAKADTVLVSDLTWPPYLAHLRQVAYRQDKHVAVVKLKDDLLDGQLTANELVQRIATTYDRYGCDSWFLEPVSYLGVGLPLHRIVKQLGQIRPCKFSVLDAAQTLGHRSLAAEQVDADLVIGGAHKWVRGYHPLRFGGTAPRSASHVKATIHQMVSRKQTHDPLLKFSTSLGSSGFGETVNVLPMITAAAALSRFEDPRMQQQAWSIQLDNHERIRRQFAGTGTVIVFPVRTRTAIVLLSIGNNRMNREGRKMLLKAGIVASGFEDRWGNGIGRISLPDKPLNADQLRQIQRAIESFACRPSVETRRFESMMKASTIGLSPHGLSSA